MGAWGAAVFSDDTASDIRGEYRELLEDQVADDEATRRIVNSYRHLDRDEEHVLWLALAATQFQLGRLDEGVKARAIDVIDSGRGLGLWVGAGPKELAKRKAVLNKLREQLTGPQRPRKVVRRPWRDITELTPGAVLAFAASNGEMALFRVARVDDQRVGVAPIIERLDWHGCVVPDAQVLARLTVRAGTTPALGGPVRPETYRVARHRGTDPGWVETGFAVVATIPPRDADQQTQAWVYTAWTGLAKSTERELTQ
jgi:hypothetical protein